MDPSNFKNKDEIDFNIEFLRAVSILLVLLFHFYMFCFKGGFIGVDIFFVISGFLITKILSKNEKLHLFKFYTKRIKRIFPSLLLIVLSVLFFSLIFFQRKF